MSFNICTIAKGKTTAFPDVCKTPAPTGQIPLPYPNIGMMADSNKVSTKVTITGAQVVTKASKIPKSTGDEAGNGGGMVSSSFAKEVEFTSASAKVYVQGKPVVRVFDQITGNKKNANGSILEPSQSKVDAA